MTKLGLFALPLLLLLHALAAVEVRAAAGLIEGRVAREDGGGIAGVGVTIDGTSEVALTEAEGEFEFRNVREGTYSLTFILLDNSVTRSDVVVEGGKTTRVDQVVDWAVTYVETVTVRSVSRRRERIVDAPAAVTTVDEKTIQRQPAEGQLPKLLEFTPLDYGQNQLYDFSLSTRGFNRPGNRNVRVLMDGRDTAEPFTQGTEWGTLALPLDDLADVELQRGPAAALYGANSTGGVMSMTTRAPRDSKGGRVRVAAGEGSTLHLDGRWAGGLGNDWYLKVLGSRRAEDYYAVSRLTSVEYSEPCTVPNQTNCLPLDQAPFFRDRINILTGALRIDKYLSGGSALTLEGGGTTYTGTVFTNQGGTRGQVDRTTLPWARFNFSSEHWNVLAYYQERDATSLELTSNTYFGLTAYNARIQAQTNWAFAGDKVRLVAGAWIDRDNIDTVAARERIENTKESVHGQVDWNVTKAIKLVGAASFDHSDLHDWQVSPRAGVVWAVHPKHTLRLTYNKAFQVLSYLEYLLYWPMGPPQDLASLEAICGGCGLDSVLPLALGNESLELEQTQMVELGYKAILGSKAFLAFDYYESRNEEFSTSYIPQITPDGQTNPEYGPWTPDPSFGVSPADVLAIRAAAEAMFVDPATGIGSQLTNLDGESILLVFSVKNLGRVDTRGADVELVYNPLKPLKVSWGYSWFDFDIKERAQAIEAVVWPNAPEHRTYLGVAWVAPKWDVDIRGRWTDDFRWANGLMDGLVEAYTTIDLSGNYRLNRNWMVGAHITNLLDNTHWETFGGSQPPRRALFHVTFDW